MSFWVLAVMVFAVTFAGMIALQYQATTGGNQADTDAHQDVLATPDAATHIDDQQVINKPVAQDQGPGKDTGVKSMLAGLFSDADDSSATDTG